MTDACDDSAVAQRCGDVVVLDLALDAGEYTIIVEDADGQGESDYDLQFRTFPGVEVRNCESGIFNQDRLVQVSELVRAVHNVLASEECPYEIPRLDAGTALRETIRTGGFHVYRLALPTAARVRLDIVNSLSAPSFMPCVELRQVIVPDGCIFSVPEASCNGQSIRIERDLEAGEYLVIVSDLDRQDPAEVYDLNYLRLP